MPAPYNQAQPVPPPIDPLPTLRLNSRGRAYLSQALIQRLGLRNTQPANIVPVPNTRFWYLDLRPNALRKISWYKDTRPRIECIALPEGLIRPDAPLVLELAPGEPPFPGFYLLQPHALAA